MKFGFYQTKMFIMHVYIINISDIHLNVLEYAFKFWKITVSFKICSKIKQ